MAVKTPSSTHLQLLERKNTFIFPRQRPATADAWQLLPATRVFRPERRENPRTWPSALPGGRKRAASSPSGATVCVSQTQEAPGLGQGDWNCALWAKLPNAQARKAEKTRAACSSVPAPPSRRRGPTNLTQKGMFLSFSGTSAMFAPNEQPGQGCFLPWETQALVNIPGALSFFQV